jgi:hypothetical protein
MANLPTAAAEFRLSGGLAVVNRPPLRLLAGDRIGEDTIRLTYVLA